MRYITTLCLIFQSFLGFSQGNLITIRPGEEGKDALIWSIEPNNNFGDISKFLCMSWSFSGSPGIDRSLIQFDFSSIPTNRSVKKATLNLYYKDLEPNITYHTGNNESTLRLITEPWDENAVTWNNAPSTTNLHQVSLPRSVSPQQNYLDIDVTEAIIQLIDKPNEYFGLELRLMNELPYTCLLFASSDIAQVELRPKLVIELEEQELTALFEFENLGERVFRFNNLSAGYSHLEWAFGDGNSSQQVFPIHVFDSDGIYPVCLTTFNSTEQKTYCLDVDVCQELVQGDYFFKKRGTVFTFLNEVTNAESYIWNFGDGTNSNEPNPVHNFILAGNYDVKLIAFNDCSATEIVKSITVHTSYPESNREFDWLIVYPNPSDGNISIRSNYAGILEIELFEMDGKLILRDQIKSVPKETGNYHLKLMSGVYELRAWAGELMFRKKLVVLNK